ncbi:VIT domain-containing protein [Kribbella sp. CA-293567]|uniref:VIT domain-containing protein n=1 Tax=Kribbella sp. CA-293567 TaxID=3002436 RepID=UPI0022DD8A54|nr:VIT domain-containing protein [Kribbella sp. CA-293567]WBQ04777.1 VIT domain-containing protein [Kribbella sp. CA-293567]
MTVLPALESGDRPDLSDDAGLGALSTERGNLPLERIDAHATITGLVAGTVLTQDFRNPYDVPLEATYIFPLPPRAAVTTLRMTADGRTVEAELQERAQARETYDNALAAGQRASIAEEERPDVFTLRVGNILPGELVTIQLTLVMPLPYEDGEATYRLPLVVAPRYIPGHPLTGPSVGDGVVPDTDAVPDASRITPPILLPGFPNPVRLSITADLDPSGLPLQGIRSSLHAIATQQGDHGTTVAIEPGERVDRDFILRLAYGEAEATATAFTLHPDPINQATQTNVAQSNDSGEGTFELTILPPLGTTPPRARDVVLVLDRSGSMSGWKMIAARRAAARIVDTLTPADRFAVLSFDTFVERPAGLPEGLSAGTDRHRFRAVEHLAGLTARGGTEMLAPLREAATLLSDGGERDRVVVLVTDGQVGNEDQLLSELAGPLTGVRIHTVGIDRAVNAGFLSRLAGLGGGRCELVESEDRLDEALDRIHLRIGTPLLTGLELSADGLTLLTDSISPARTPNAFAGVPLVLRGRYRGRADNATATLRGITASGDEWHAEVPAAQSESTAASAVWARGHLRDLEDRYSTAAGDVQELEQRIVAVSLRHQVLCRFTALVAVDSRVVNDGGPRHQVTQPVELPSGWDHHALAMPAAFAAAPGGAQAASDAAFPAAAAGGAGRPLPRSSARLRPGLNAMSRSAMHSAPAGFSEELQSAHDPLTEARAQAAAEAQLLRTAGTPTLLQRRIILSDLASRLDALLRTTGSEAEALRQLITELAALDSSTAVVEAELDALWERALRVLDEFAGTTPTTGGPADDAHPAPADAVPKRQFWKRS